MRRLGVVLLALAAVACRPIPVTHYYVLAPPEQDAGNAGVGVRLGVETFAVDPPYDQERLVYRVGRAASEVGFYDHHRWAAPPGRLVATALAAGLAGTPGLAAVEPARVNGDYSALLAGRVIALEEVDLPERQLARIQVDLKLFDENGALVWSRLVTVEDGGRAEDVADVMRRMQSAFAKLVAEVRSALESFLGRRDAQDHDGSFRP